MSERIYRGTVSTDEDGELGFMLADEHAPTTAAERRALFCERAGVEWDLHYDPKAIIGGEEPRPFVDTDEGSFPAGDGEKPDSHWYVFTDLPEAESKACGYCGAFLGHAPYCERAGALNQERRGDA